MITDHISIIDNALQEYINDAKSKYEEYECIVDQQKSNMIIDHMNIIAKPLQEYTNLKKKYEEFYFLHSMAITSKNKLSDSIVIIDSYYVEFKKKILELCDKYKKKSQETAAIICRYDTKLDNIELFRNTARKVVQNIQTNNANILK